MNDYRIKYSYVVIQGQRRHEIDVSMASTAQEAVDNVRRWYDDLEDLRIEDVWVDRQSRWEVTGAWD